jgi:GNAT superfamily N-acetyltransferase
VPTIEVAALSDAQVEQVCNVLPLERLAQGDGGYLDAWLDGAPVVHVYVARTTPPELQDVFVLEPHRRKGIASTLLEAAEADCCRASCTEVCVSVSVEGVVAKTLYESRGYRDTGIAPRRVLGTVQLRSGPFAVDDTLLTLVKPLPDGTDT